METKEQLEAKIKELQAIVDKMPDEPKGLWKPNIDDTYFYISDEGVLCTPVWKNTVADYRRYSYGNVIRTEEGARNKKENTKVHQQLKEIANELNNGVEIDWSNIHIAKWYLVFNFNVNCIHLTNIYGHKSANTVYCLSNKFKDIALKRIGKEKLERYLKEGF